MDLKLNRTGTVYNVRWQISPGKPIWSPDGTQRFLGRKHKSYLVLNNIYISPDWIVMEKQESYDLDNPPSYRILHEDDQTGKEIIEFVKKEKKKDGKPEEKTDN